MLIISLISICPFQHKPLALRLCGSLFTLSYILINPVFTHPTCECLSVAMTRIIRTLPFASSSGQNTEVNIVMKINFVETVTFC